MKLSSSKKSSKEVFVLSGTPIQSSDYVVLASFPTLEAAQEQVEKWEGIVEWGRTDRGWHSYLLETACGVSESKRHMRSYRVTQVPVYKAKK